MPYMDDKQKRAARLRIMEGMKQKVPGGDDDQPADLSLGDMLDDVRTVTEQKKKEKADEEEMDYAGEWDKMFGGTMASTATGPGPKKPLRKGL